MDKTAVLWQCQSGEARQLWLKRQLAQFNRHISPSAKAAKYDKMALDAFVFYRGTAHLYYDDLASQNVLQKSYFNPETALCWLQGDMHVENYGVFCDGKGDVIYDLNDFDESWIDSYLYDLYRLAVSLLLVLQRQKTLSDNVTIDATTLLNCLSDSYLQRLSELAEKPQLKSQKMTEQQAYGKLKKFMSKAKAANSREKMLDKWTLTDHGQRRFNFALDKLKPVDNLTVEQITKEIQAYHHQLESSLQGNNAYFRVIDVAQRLNAGTGSLGTERYYVLIDGHSPDLHDYRILDVKQQGLPSHYSYLSNQSLKRMKALFPNDAQGCRVAAAQEAMLVHADEHLGSIFIHGRSFSVRERSPYKKTLNTTKLTKDKHLYDLSAQWGSILATAHARAERPVKWAGGNNLETLLGNLDETDCQRFAQQLVNFATGYSRQVLLDHELYLSLKAQLLPCG